jgi:hypothetical protein
MKFSTMKSIKSEWDWLFLKDTKDPQDAKSKK